MATRPTIETSDTLLRVERQVLELIATGASLGDVLDALCRTIDEQSGLMSGVYLLDHEGAQLSLAAGPHLPELWARAGGTVQVSDNEGACGPAVIRGEQVIVENFAESPSCARWRDAARAAGIASVWSTPFFSKDGRTLGTFAVFDGSPRFPDAAHLKLVARATYLASIAVERHETEVALRRSEALLRLVLDAIPVGVAVMNPRGDIILSNPASSRIWGRMITGAQERYARSRAWWLGSGREIEPHEWASRLALTKGETAINQLLEIESFDGVRKIVQNSAVPIRDDQQNVVGAVVINEDVSARVAADRRVQSSLSRLRALTTRLMRAQDDERRRIAQMLHETTAQDLAALKMLLARLGRTSTGLSVADRNILVESSDLADHAMSGVRTLSYLLHPPFLEENGLLSAVRWYSAGFADRSGITIDLDQPPSFPRLPADVEMTLFRVVQEALINIHRHAKSPTARIKLRLDSDLVTLEVEDRGVGMPEEMISRARFEDGLLGVGVAGMRERLKQLGGELEIESGDHGTLVRARLPVAQPSTAGRGPNGPSFAGAA